MATSTPPPVRRLTSATTSTWVKSSDDVGAHAACHREADRVAVDADDERRAHQLGAGGGAQADRPLGEDHDRVADPHAARLGAAKPVEAMSASRTTCSSVTPSGIGARLAWAVGTSRYSAWAPSIVLPKRQPPRPRSRRRGRTGRGCRTGRRGTGRRRDRADEHAFADLVAGHARPQLLDHADRLVADDQPGSDRVLALDDVDVGAADRRRA